ncbi:hypothetical protein AAVH_34082 [Aphelenchoides avenae]|nr:hypothetical protein AAVH_34082 [Aphelenchus avenae]
MNVLISIQALYDYFKAGEYSDNEIKNFTKGMSDNALDTDDSERDTAAIAFDPTNLLRLTGFVDQTFFHNLRPHFDDDMSCMAKTSSSFAVDSEQFFSTPVLRVATA